MISLFSRKSKSFTKRRFAPQVMCLEGRQLLTAYTVTNTFASGAGSLAAAVQQANLDPNNDTITFAPSVTGQIALTSQLDINNNGTLSIVGPGSMNLTISNANGRVFQTHDATVTISNLGFANSRAVSGDFTPGAGGDGGAIMETGGNLTLNNDIFSNNFATNRGGAVFNFYGNLNVNGCLFAGNSTVFHGGAIYNSGVMNASGNIFSANRAGYGGGAIESARSILALSGVTATLNGNIYVGNSAAQGGAVEVANGTSISSSNELFVSNRSTGDGGALSVGDPASLAAVSNDVFLGNVALGNGGAINSKGFLSLVNSTLQYNNALSGGGYYALASGLSQSGNTITFNSQPQTVTV